MRPCAPVPREATEISANPTHSAAHSPSVVYISYDGAGEPLGRSQIVPYLERLAVDRDVRLISFEKGAEPSTDLARRLREAGIEWLPLSYHRNPPLASTLLDVVRGATALNRTLRERPAALVHTRSYVATEMVLRSFEARSTAVLFDIRGFWADERIEGGIWRKGPLYRYAKRRERAFFARADAIVTLTHASVPVIRRWVGGRDIPIEVIPTCAEVDRFSDTEPRPAGPHAVWIGSISTWYRFDLAARLARAAELPFTVFTREPEKARAAAPQADEVRTVSPAELPRTMHAGDIGLCLYKSGFSRLACAPTRFAEYLAAGMPTAVTPEVGDLARIVAEEQVGMVVEGDSHAALRAAGDELVDLAADPAVRERCRHVAAKLFDVDEGARLYADLYDRMGRVPRSAASLSNSASGRAQRR